MSPLRTPRTLGEPAHVDTGEAILRFELLEEIDGGAARTEREVQATLDALRHHDAEGRGATGRAELVDAAADAVWRLVVQHEACNCSDHRLLLERYRVPAEVMARIGARH